ncbi:DNA-3-methyladenine glycosylase [Neolewinella agarilytica]|uniref:Putative 3-methyladenine DNA glycosylase n=1 Tax=Neolewinella agarilytica TaxID=478744 RepID=A0A1H9L4Q5_9BACT|nr:DNA-3-methyladenine glycosylase [Neolewinella agarilytica]SER06481.1 DNA-3-methyladenine glycosylase [Neolewinella agarilytica]
MLLSLPDPVQIARALIGAELITTTDGVETAVRITETEAYWAPDDRASHAHGNKRTKRTEVFFHAPGTAYVYLCYGIHEMFNVVTGPEGTPHAVLIRAGEPTRGLSHIMARRKMDRLKPQLSSGPGVLTKALGIDRRLNGVNLLDPEGEVRLDLTGPAVDPAEIIATPRIGIDYAGAPWVSKPWRFYRRGTTFVSQLNAFKKR